MADMMILLVDDDEDDVFFFKDVVARNFPGVQIRDCGNGEEAMHFLKNGEQRPNWIFIDLNMPRMNGLQLLKALKEEGLAPAPLIIYTTSHLEKDKDATRELGAHHYIVKPTRVSELVDAIRDVMEKDWRAD